MGVTASAQTWYGFPRDMTIWALWSKWPWVLSAEPVLTNSRHSGIHYVFPAPGVLNAVIFKGDDHVVGHDILTGMGERIPEITISAQRPGYYIYQAGKKMDFDPEQLVLHTAEDNPHDSI